MGAYILLWQKRLYPKSPRSFFTVHGLWPSNYSTPGQKCVGTPFSRAEMSSTANHGLRHFFLPIAWPQLIARFSDMDFWQQEYDRHATCSENNLHQTEYFRKAYLLWFRYNAYHLFAISPTPIYPGKLYSLTQLENAIQRVTQHQPVLMCRQIRVGRIVYWLLQEVIICFDKLGNNVVRCG
ncbi:hypothetical protein ACLB2K_018003 [Fragaria x ananassa]